MHQGIAVAFAHGILHGSGNVVDNPTILDGVGQLRAVLNHHHVGALGGTLDFAFELGVDFSVLEVVGLKGDVVELAEVFSGGGNAAGVAVHNEGAFLGLGLFNQLVMGQVFTGGNRIRHGGKGGHDGHEQARGQHKRK